MKEHIENTLTRQLPLNPSLLYNEGMGLEGADSPPVRFPVFTIEMETGTGKTYTYLRTVHELKKYYGFRKFIVVVPSIAIFEGTLVAFEQTKSHFNTLYENDNTNLTDYDGSHPEKLRNFATSQFIEIMVMTIQSFNTAMGRGANNIYKRSDKLPGDLLPYQWIQKTRPILILDESQNYNSEKSKQALRTLNPLFAINYSATPGKEPEEIYNLVYRLSPVDAFLFNLVKKIKVWGFTQNTNSNISQMHLESVSNKNNKIQAVVKAPVIENNSKIEKKITLKKDSELFSITKNPDFKDITVEEISFGEKKILFNNQKTLTLEDSILSDIAKKEIYRVQIEKTIEYHFERQKKLRELGIKVLSLFFIDHVANYKGSDPVIRNLFEEIFDRLKKTDDYFKHLKASEVHNGYFAQKKDKKTGEETFLDDFSEADAAERRQLEKEAFHLIMRDKETLLSFSSNISFIFAHSALREGWDNPNVFTICLLKEPRYDTTNQQNTRRQELGRGLRICVNQKGERVKDEDVNILTVVCPEDFSTYVGALQKEYAATGDITPPKPTNARTSWAKRNDTIFGSDDFGVFWKRISCKTEYEISLDSSALIKKCIESFNSDKVVIPEPQIILTKGEFVITDYTFELKEITSLGAKILLIITNTNQRYNQCFDTYSVGWDFAREINDINLRGYKISEIDKAKQTVYFGNGEVLTKTEPLHFNNEITLAQDRDVIREEKRTYPVFNLIDRAAKATYLTYPTLLKIFKGIVPKKKSKIFYNPEGFATLFINTIKENLADHVAENISYHVIAGDEEYNISMMQGFFPPQKEYPQKELIPGSLNSLYDQIQIDSDVEERFVKKRLQMDDREGNIICYFKFPSDFKIKIPKVILNYNPDWGIIRIDKAGNRTLHLVRETKGSIDAGRLRFPNERRKILCAQKHFKALGVSYRQVSDTTDDWYLDEQDE
jgi:type III restriction enzyme